MKSLLKKESKGERIMDIFKWFRKREEAHKYVFNIDQCGAIAILLCFREK